jgi:hypothetical protein
VIRVRLGQLVVTAPTVSTEPRATLAQLVPPGPRACKAMLVLRAWLVPQVRLEPLERRATPVLPEPLARQALRVRRVLTVQLVLLVPRV